MYDKNTFVLWDFKKVGVFVCYFWLAWNRDLSFKKFCSYVFLICFSISLQVSPSSLFFALSIGHRFWAVGVFWAQKSCRYSGVVQPQSFWGGCNGPYTTTTVSVSFTCNSKISKKECNPWCFVLGDSHNIAISYCHFCTFECMNIEEKWWYFSMK